MSKHLKVWVQNLLTYIVNQSEIVLEMIFKVVISKSQQNFRKIIYSKMYTVFGRKGLQWPWCIIIKCGTFE